ncbi:MAG: zinc transporter ZupT [Oscillospiraceae bacterium]|nr:zinc transporter ZupT [Oscillospiraceae bacterium]
MSNAVFAFLLTLMAGLATGLGGLVALLSNAANKKFLAICLSFSAGVMVYISFAEILLEAIEALEDVFAAGYLIATAAFFGGIILIALIDKFIPHDDEEVVLGTKSGDEKELKRTGIMSAVAISIHNFPEGLVTFMAAMYDPALGVVVAIAIALHNIPEGIAISAPIYYATGSKRKALLASIGSGLTEPLGGLAGWLLVQNLFGDVEGIFGITFALVGGVMVFVAIHQLLPAAQKYGEHHLVMKWFFAGMAVMAVSLVALEYAF